MVTLKPDDLEKVLSRRRSLWHLDSCIRVGESLIPINRQQLSIQSPYFRHLLSSNFDKETILPLGETSPIVVEMLLSALMVGVLAVPQDYSLEGWVELASLTDYFCLSSLKSACEIQLCSKIDDNNYSMLEKLSEELELSQLAMHCANHILRV